MNDNNKALTPVISAGVLEKVVIEGDLTNLTSNERVVYYKHVCDSLGVNPLTKPFAYIKLNNKLVLYAQRDCTDQLRRLHSISTQLVSSEKLDDVYIVKAKASTPDGRTDEATGAVSIASLRGEALANALMKAETKAKRRVTLSIVGLGWLDETEVESVPGAVLMADEQLAAPPPTQRRPEPPTGRASEPEGGDRPATQAMLDRWGILFAEAQHLGMQDLPVIKANISAEALTIEGRKLKVRMDERKAELEAMWLKQGARL